MILNFHKNKSEYHPIILTFLIINIIIEIQALVTLNCL